MEEKKKSNKGLIVLVVVLIVMIILGLIGYICYGKFMVVEDASNNPVKDNVTVNDDFYSVSNLVKNKYIKEITSTSSELVNNTVIKISSGKVLVADDLSKEKPSLIDAKGISGTPKYVYASLSHSVSATLFVVLTEEGDLYSSNAGSDVSKAVVKEFTKLNSSKVDSIYDFNYDLGGFVNYPTKPLTIYALCDNSLVSVYTDGYLDNKPVGKMDSTFKIDFPNPDMIASRCVEDSCDALYVSYDKKLFDGTNEIKISGDSLNVKDGFVKTVIGSTGDIVKASYYIIDNSNNIYLIEKDSSKIVDSKLYSEKKISSYEYNDNSNTVTISYSDGSTEKIDMTYMSTLYYRYNK